MPGKILVQHCAMVRENFRDFLRISIFDSRETPTLFAESEDCYLFSILVIIIQRARANTPRRSARRVKLM